MSRNSFTVSYTVASPSGKGQTMDRSRERKPSSDEFECASALADLPLSPFPSEKWSRQGSTQSVPISPGLFNALRTATGSAKKPCWKSPFSTFAGTISPIVNLQGRNGTGTGGCGSLANSPFTGMSPLTHNFGFGLTSPPQVFPGSMPTPEKRSFVQRLDFASEKSTLKRKLPLRAKVTPQKATGNVVRGGTNIVRRQYRIQNGRVTEKPTPDKARKGKNASNVSSATKTPSVSHVSFSTPSARNRNSRLNLSGGGSALTYMTPSPSERGSNRNPCNCKKSRCLKLYCECFAASVYCKGCNCKNCANNVESEPARTLAVKATLSRNPTAFQAKISGSPGTGGSSGVHSKGCRCKKSGCLKKYCECFQNSVWCGANCKCNDCKNYENSPALAKRALDSKVHGKPKMNLLKKRALSPSVTTAGAVVQPQVGQPGSLNPYLKTKAGMTSVVRFAPPGTPFNTGTIPVTKTQKLSLSSSSARISFRVAPKSDSNLLHKIRAFPDREPIQIGLVLVVFTYLDNEDLYNASLVSKCFERLALHDCLWKYPTQTSDNSKKLISDKKDAVVPGAPVKGEKQQFVVMTQ